MALYVYDNIVLIKILQFYVCFLRSAQTLFFCLSWKLNQEISANSRTTETIFLVDLSLQDIELSGFTEVFSADWRINIYVFFTSTSIFIFMKAVETISFETICILQM